MKAEPRTVDYRKAKTSALQPLAAAGDRAAVQELERRGVIVGAAVDITKLEYLALRSLVLAWRDGVMPEERARNRSLAEEAQRELEIRYRVDSKLFNGTGRAPRQPPAPPWDAPDVPRCRAWQRPTGSTLYPSHFDRARADMEALASQLYRERNVH
jgi:hypothetical protein